MVTFRRGRKPLEELLTTTRCLSFLIRGFLLRASRWCADISDACHVKPEHFDTASTSEDFDRCRRAEASSGGPWWADGWATYKEDYDRGTPSSPRTQLLSHFDALDIQKGEMLAVAQQSQSEMSQKSRSSDGLACKFGDVKNRHLRALVQGDRTQDAEAAALAAEEMTLLLSTGKVKQSAALRHWSERLPHDSSLADASSRTVFALDLPTCLSVVLGVHGIQVK